MNDPRTVELVQRCCQGDDQAIDTLIRTCHPLVFRLALSLLDDPDEAEEAAQEALFLALRALPSFRGEASLQTWLYRITLNACRSRLRKRHARERLEWFLRRTTQQGLSPAARIEDLVLQAELHNAVWQAVKALDEKHRLAVILRYYHDLPVKEIAQITQVSQRTVHTRLRQAHERLRKLLNELKA